MSDPGPELPDDPDAALAAEYVLRLLDPAEAAACAAREARDPAFAALVADWRAEFEALDGAYAEVPPPAGLQRQIEDRLFGQERREPSWLARLWQSAGVWRGVAAAAVLAALWLGTLAPPPAPVEGEARLISALASQPGSDVSMLAELEPQAAVLNINRTSGAAQPGRSLELWIIEEGGDPVSLGVLPEETRARVPLTREQADVIGRPGSLLAITDEPPGGSPTGQPNVPPVAIGPVSEL
jgi:anti-sigma-K factor RskA